MREQFNNRAHQTQFGASTAARANSPQPTVTPHMRDEHIAKSRQQRDGDGNQREHPRPCLEATYARLMKAEQAFRIPKAFLTGEAPDVLRGHRVRRQVPVREQVPDAPPSVAVTRTRLHEEYLSWVALAVPDPPPRPSALILHPTQGVEPLPAACDPDVVVGLRADDVRNAQFVEQIEQINIREPPISRQHKAPPSHARQDLGEEGAQELALIETHPLFQLRRAVRAPVERQPTPPDGQGGDQQVLRLFRRPIKGEAHTALGGQPPHERASMSARQRFSLQPFVVEQAREAFTGRLEVIKESDERRLTATPHADEREDKIRDGLLLMPVCVGQNEADILAEASGKRALGHRRNNALTRGQPVTTRLFFQMCPDFRETTLNVPQI